MKLKATLFITGTFFLASLTAAPAPWHKWESKIDGKVVCAQTSPGDGWKKLKGAYKDVRCEKPDRGDLKKGSRVK